MTVSATAYAAVTSSGDQLFIDTMATTVPEAMQKYLTLYVHVEVPAGIGDFALRDLFAKHRGNVQIATVTVTI